MTFWGIVLAAGTGERFGRPKHGVMLEGRALWEWARDCLTDAGAAEVVVVGPVAGGVAGGGTRRDSVAIGLTHVPDDVLYVLVHDAARPLASPKLARRVLERLERGDVAGVVPALPLRDTVKRLEDDERVAETLDRSRLVAVQTPQGFVTAALRRAHAELEHPVEHPVTDDAALVEALGEVVVTVAGEESNIKITYPGDLKIAEAMR